jgi:predicted RNA-binding Zn-ribbon protein involved in translation (DUF1610 family)
MTVELYELAKSDKDEDIDVFNQYFKEKYIHDGYAPAHNTPGYEISFRTDVEYGVRFDDAEKTGYSWQLLIELVCQEAENETPASKPCNFHENANGLKRLKEIRKEIRVRNNSQKQPENVDNESEIVNDVDETVIETSESVTDESDGDLDPVETVEADIIQTVPEETASDSRLTPTKMKHSGDYYTCPSCGAVLVAEYYTKQIFWNFCPYCGQAIVRTDAKTSNPDRPEWYRRFFFGAYSKNNRPIREGDIIEVNGRQFRIDWDQKEFRFIAEAVVKKYRYADHEMCPIYEITKSEIVGSIYEEETDGIH